MLNAAAKTYNRMPKPNSKTQKEKAKNKKKVNFVCCAKCGNKNKTLYKVDSDYYCSDCKE